MSFITFYQRLKLNERGKSLLLQTLIPCTPLISIAQAIIDQRKGGGKRTLILIHNFEIKASYLCGTQSIVLE
jgi:hypothetical protein